MTSSGSIGICWLTGIRTDSVWGPAPSEKMHENIFKTSEKRQVPIRNVLLTLSPLPTTTLPCKAKMQYLLTLQVSGYCLWALQSSIVVFTRF